MKKLLLTTVLLVLTFVGVSLLVRGAYGAGGDLPWEDQFDKAGNTDEAGAVAVSGGRVFAVGRGTNTAGNGDFLIRAYDAR